MRNKRRIIIISICVFVVLVIVLSSAIFNVRHVDVEFYSTDDAKITDMSVLTYFTEDDLDDITKSAKINGKSVFLIKKQKYIDNLESANPYLKVVGLEIVFPDRVRVKAIEREELYYYEADDKYVVLDTEFKVLRITTAQPSLIKVDGVQDTVCEAGSFIDKYNLSNVAKSLNEAYVTNVKALSLFSKIEIVEELVKDDEESAPYRVNSLKMYTRYGDGAGVTIVIQNVNLNLGDKILGAIEVYDQLLSNPSETGSVAEGVIKILNNGTKVYNKVA